MRNLISIIIIVKNDPEVESTLSSLVFLSRIKYEVIIVDSSEGKLDYIKQKFTKLKWINFTPISANKITIPEQRNAGIKISNGNVVVFLDASCIPQKGWLKKLTSPILDGNELIVAGSTNSRKQSTLHDITAKINRNKMYLEEAPTLNLSIQKKVFDYVGYFDEDFEYGSDVDFTWRCRDKGIKIYYEPRAIVEHNWGEYRSEIRRSFYYGMARAKLYKKFPKRLGYALKNDIISIYYPLFLIFLPLTIIIPQYLLVLIIPFIKNVNNKPIQTIQEHIIRGCGIIYGLIYK